MQRKTVGFSRSWYGLHRDRIFQVLKEYIEQADVVVHFEVILVIFNMLTSVKNPSTFSKRNVFASVIYKENCKGCVSHFFVKNRK